ncbi:MAG: hypothetical protein ACR2MN_13475 [Acidimicrobiales bacterium]
MVGVPDIPPELMGHRPAPAKPHLVGSRTWCALLGHPVVQGVARWVSDLSLGTGEEVATKKAVSLLSAVAAGSITPAMFRRRVCRTALQAKPLRQQISWERPVDPTSYYGQAVLAGATQAATPLPSTEPPPVAAYLRTAVGDQVAPQLWTAGLCDLIDGDADVAATEALRVAVETGWSGEELLAALRSSGPTKSRRLAQYLAEPRLAVVFAGRSSVGVAGALLWHFGCGTASERIPRRVLAAWGRTVGEIAAWRPPPPQSTAGAGPVPVWTDDVAMCA